ncbi:arylesterase [Luteimonas terricola]|uniref:Arylesterase n=1 Tax=Luteimonas terricola TaxID=645597 RepID=A0ABQ2EJT1_9GAMM|nr:arylesterase [Luteimonas terricola]GGK14665.1 arylesterase [Luteimonas terricola]
MGLCVLLLATAAQAQTTAAAPDTDAPRTVLVMGDSLSAAYGLRADQGWVALLAGRIAAEHPGWQVVNASISGETSAGGSARVVGEVLRHHPDVVVIALGANDALRGLPLAELKYNLARMIGASRHVGAQVLLVGMRMPPNLGAEYTRAFERTYRDLASFFDIELLPFLLEPVAADRGHFLDDNLHPTAEAQPAISDHVGQALAPLLR